MRYMQSLRAVLLFAVVGAPVWAAQGAGVQGPEGRLEIHVDERCRIYSQDRESQGGKYSRPGFHADVDMCRLQNEMKTKHWEGSVENGIVRRTQVTVIEHTFQLHNPTDQAITYLVEQSVPKGWRIDSTPQPARMEDQVAIFEVVAQPGQTIKLHVGLRN